jgi:adenylate cyclase
VGAAYLVLTWVLLQIADLIVPALSLPEWTLTLLVVLGALGFPFAIFFAWAYEITPNGIVADSAITDSTKQTQTESATIESSDSTNQKSIAVLPFANMSTDNEQQHFCDGLTEEMINVLAQLSDLSVASRTSCFAFKDSSVNLKEIASKLKVAHIVEGSVRKSGNSIRITAQLIEAGTDTHLWSETYDRQLDDIFKIQDDIANRILEALKLTLKVKQSDYLMTSNVKAYEYYLRAVGHSNSKGDKDQALAIKLFQKAVSLDPDFVRCWIKLAESSALHSIFFIGGNSCLTIAAEAGAKAIELAPDYAESYMARGFSYMASKNYAAAEKDFFKAIELDSTLSIAYHNLARCAFFQNKPEKAIEYYRKSTELDPDDYESPLLLVTLYQGLNDAENAIGFANIGIDRAKRHLENHPNNQRAYYLSTSGLIAKGQLKEAQKWAERAIQIAPDDPATRYNVCCFYSNIGQHEKALDYLENSIASRSWIANDPDLEPLHKYPRFQTILETLSD